MLCEGTTLNWKPEQSIHIKRRSRVTTHNTKAGCILISSLGTLWETGNLEKPTLDDRSKTYMANCPTSWPFWPHPPKKNKKQKHFAFPSRRSRTQNYRAGQQNTSRLSWNWPTHCTPFGSLWRAGQNSKRYALPLFRLHQ